MQSTGTAEPAVRHALCDKESGWTQGCLFSCTSLPTTSPEFFCFFHLGENFKLPWGIIKMQGGDDNGFSFVLITLQWHCVVYLHSVERDKSKVMQLSPRDSFLQAAPRTENGGKHQSFSIYMTLINCS